MALTSTQQLSEQDQKAFKLYGKIPGKNLLSKMQKVSDAA